jgi:hypothetical protein
MIWTDTELSRIASFYGKALGLDFSIEVKIAQKEDVTPDLAHTFNRLFLSRKEWWAANAFVPMNNPSIIFISPVYLETASKKDIINTLIHEVLHCKTRCGHEEAWFLLAKAFSRKKIDTFNCGHQTLKTTIKEFLHIPYKKDSNI